MFDANTSTLTVNTAGRYLVQGRMVWGIITQPTTAFRAVRIAVNGGVYAEDDQPFGTYANPSQAVSAAGR
ncbi:hypothetical protein [Streptomyces erythrochromogenes]|uniref:hypothetical protein n=1 Tax=Streptomyces erythrochromogenes TaxID=285574 RepID=UPI0036FABCF8